MSREAMKLALEALESLIKKTSGQAIYSFMEPERRIAMAACVGLREALAEPTSADYAMGYAEGFNDACKPAQQEPVAWERPIVYTPPHMTPPTWVGLTDEERAVIVEAHTTDDHGYDIWCDGDGVARAIEAKLKEKNT